MMSTATFRRTAAAAGLLTSLLFVAACGSEADPAADDAAVTVSSCGFTTTVPVGEKKLYVDAWRGLIEMTLLVGAEDRVSGWGSYDDDQTFLTTAFGGDLVASLPEVRKGDATVESVLVSEADLMFTNAGPVADQAESKGIAVYRSADTCPVEEEAPVTSSWETLYADMKNLGLLTDHVEDADQAVTELRGRLATLSAAAQESERPTVFLFDRGEKDVYSSGGAGPVDRIIEAAGGTNALHDLPISWTTVSWEELVAAEPDFIAIADYPGQSVEQKIEVLRTNPATRNLPAVKASRFLSLPVAAWVSSPLNVDAAEYLRKSLEEAGLLPVSEIEPARDLG